MRITIYMLRLSVSSYKNLMKVYVVVVQQHTELSGITGVLIQKEQF